MKWITKRANDMNAKSHVMEKIARGAPALWDNICRAVEQAVKDYRSAGVLPVEFSGRADHTIEVIVFNQADQTARGTERDRVKIVFDSEHYAVEVHMSSSPGVLVFPMRLDANGQVVLADPEGKLIPMDVLAERFTELVLADAFFPGS